MPEFLAQTYAPRDAAGTAARRVGQAALADAPCQPARSPGPLPGCDRVPGEETCFRLYRAPSADAVRAAMTRAGLRPDRITPAAWIRSPRRAVTSPGPGAATPRAPAAGRSP